jgi:hypothetical protein
MGVYWDTVPAPLSAISAEATAGGVQTGRRPPGSLEVKSHLLARMSCYNSSEPLTEVTSFGRSRLVIAGEVDHCARN